MKPRITALLIALALALAACGGNGGNGGDEPEAAEGGDGNADGDAVEVDVSMVDIDYEPDAATVPEGGSLVVNLTNDGQMEHDFQLEDGSGSGVLQAGEAETVEVGPFDESTVAYCTVPGHRESGMEFEINVE